MCELHLGEMVLQHCVDKAIATTYTLKEHTFCAVVEETGIVPGDVAVEVEDEAEGEVLKTGFTKNQPKNQPRN